MFCGKCGCELTNDQRFCPVCGEKVQQEAVFQQETKENVDKANPIPKKKTHWKWKVIAVLVLLCLVVGGALTVKWYFSPEQKIARSLEQRDYEKAYMIYEDADGDINSDRLIESLTIELNTVKQQFQEGTIDYKDASNALATIENMNLKRIRTTLDEVKAYIEKLNQSMTAYQTGLTFLERENYEDSIAYLQQVIQEDRNYEDAQTRLTEAMELYRQQVLAKAGEYENNQEYDKAIVLLRQVLNVLPEDATVTEKITVLQAASKNKKIEDTKVYAAEVYSTGDIPSAISILRNAIQEYGENADFENMLNDYEEIYYNWAIGRADELTAGKNYQEAIELLKNAATILNNYELSEKIDNIQNLTPVDITTLELFNISDDIYINTDDATDRFGNSYMSASNYYVIHTTSGWYGSRSCEYRLYGAYTHISGIIAQNISGRGSYYVQIYCDGVLAYTSKSIEEKTDAFTFDVNIKDVDYMSIEVTDGSNGNIIILSDVTLHRD